MTHLQICHLLEGVNGMCWLSDTEAGMQTKQERTGTSEARLGLILYGFIWMSRQMHKMILIIYLALEYLFMILFDN